MVSIDSIFEEEPHHDTSLEEQDQTRSAAGDRAASEIPRVSGRYAFDALPTVFGGKWLRMMLQCRDYLLRTNPAQLGDIFTVAKRAIAYINAIYRASNDYTAAHELTELPADFTLQEISPSAYTAAREQFPCVMRAEAYELKKILDQDEYPDSWFHDLDPDFYVDESQILMAVALVWFREAAAASATDWNQALDRLQEVSAAIAVCEVTIAWDTAWDTVAEEKREVGKAGAAKRHTPTNLLRDFAVSEYRKRKWPSANKAAHDLLPTVLARGRELGARLSAANGQRTLADWFRAADRQVENDNPSAN